MWVGGYYIANHGLTTMVNYDLWDMNTIQKKVFLFAHIIHPSIHAWSIDRDIMGEKKYILQINHGLTTMLW
jgi:hypothetical protein